MRISADAVPMFGLDGKDAEVGTGMPEFCNPAGAQKTGQNSLFPVGTNRYRGINAYGEVY